MPPHPAGGYSCATMQRLFHILFLLLVSYPCVSTSTSPILSRHRLSPQNRVLFDVIGGCVPPATAHLISSPKHQKCPCFVSFGLSSPMSSSTFVDFLVMPNTAYTAWSTANFSGEPAYSAKYSFLSTSANIYSFVYGFFFYQTENIELTIPETFTFVARTSAEKQDCLLDVMYIFQSKPSPCPQRLPSSMPTSQTTANSSSRSLQTTTTTSTTPENHVVAGTSVTDEKIQAYMAAIRSSGGACSGTVISANYILTAAHCQVRAGGRVYVNGKTTASGVAYRVAEFIVHPQYKLSTDGLLERHDIAIIRTARKIANVKPVLLNKRAEGLTPGGYVRASGFGQIAEGWIGGPVRQLLQVDLPIVGFEECVRAFVKWGAKEFARSLDGGGHICVGFLEGECGGDTCYGDSGGPIVVSKEGKYVQVGVVSGGIGCARRGLPGIYTRVGRYFEWVSQVTNGSVGGIEIMGEGDGSLGVSDDGVAILEEIEEEAIEEAVKKVPKTGLIVAGVAGGVGGILIVIFGVWAVGFKGRSEKKDREEREISMGEVTPDVLLVARSNIGSIRDDETEEVDRRFASSTYSGRAE